MAKVIPGRMSAELDGDFVVFLIGMRINKPWKLHKWLPVARAMGPMLRVLSRQEESRAARLHVLGRPTWSTPGAVLAQLRRPRALRP